MSCDTTIDFCVRTGVTFEAVFQCATDELTTVAITAITKAAPPVITAAAHGMPDAWEAGRGLNPTVANTNARTLSSAGYTDLEVYLHELSASRISGSAL